MFQLGHFLSPIHSLKSYVAPPWELQTGNETSSDSKPFFVKEWSENEFDDFLIGRHRRLSTMKFLCTCTWTSKLKYVSASTFDVLFAACLLRLFYEPISIMGSFRKFTPFHPWELEISTAGFALQYLTMIITFYDWYKMQYDEASDIRWSIVRLLQYR